MRDDRILIVANGDEGSRLAEVVQRCDWHAINENLGSAALTTAVQQRPWLVLVHAPAVEHSHVLFCRTVRQMPELERSLIVGLVADSDPEGGERLLQSGADDCWSAAAGGDEFCSLLRTSYTQQHPDQPGQPLRWGDIELDAGRHRLRVNGNPVRLTTTQTLLLKHFLEHPCATFTEVELLDRVWHNPSLQKATVAACVRRLCQALSRAGGRTLIRRVGGTGFLLD